MVIVSLSALCSMQLLVQLCLCVCASMKKGQIVRISRQPPRDCPFQSYADLHNHWSSLVGFNTHTHTLSLSLLCSVSPDLSQCVAVFSSMATVFPSFLSRTLCTAASTSNWWDKGSSRIHLGCSPRRRDEGIYYLDHRLHLLTCSPPLS